MDKREIRGQYERSVSFTREAVNEEARTVEIAISSEAAVERWFGLETLGHGKGEVNLARLSDGGAVLLDHNVRDIVGVVESVRLDDDKVLRGVVRFGRSARAQEAFQDVVDGIRTKISVGYTIDAWETTKGEKGAPDQVRVTRWTPLEVSFVSIPADPSVGVGRSEPEAPKPNPPAAPAGTVQEVRMDPANTTAAPNAAGTPATETRGIPQTAVMELLDAAARLDCVKEVRDVLTQGGTEEQARKVMLDALQKRAQESAIQAKSGLSDKEEARYSIARAIMASATGEKCFEREVSQDLAKRLGRETNGIYIPTALKLRALDATVTATAAGLISQQPVTFIELLRNKAKVLGLGATYIPGVTGVVPFARQITGGGATWTGDNPGSGVANSDPNIETFTMGPKQLMAHRQYSKQLLVQTSGYADRFVTEDLAKAHALEVDRCAIHGSGNSNQPKGIVNFSGIGAVPLGDNGAAPDWDMVVDLETALANANADDGTMAYLTNAKVRGKLKKTLESSTAGATWIWNKDNTINGYRAESTNQVASNLVKGSSGAVCSAMVFGNWSELLVLEWGALELITDPYTLADKGLIRVISTQLVDINLRHVQSFAACLDILTT